MRAMILAFFTFVTSAQVSAQTQSKIRYVLGEIKILSPDESVAYGSNVVLAQRAYRPNSNEIFECALVIDPQRGTNLYKTIAKVNGSEFTVEDDSKTYYGSGKLFGSAWNWSAWEFSVKLLDGSGSIYAFESFEQNGMTSYKKFMNPKGETQVVMRESFKDMAKASYDLLFKELSKEQKLSCE